MASSLAPQPVDAGAQRKLAVGSSAAFFGCTIFLSAFLLFVLEPLISKLLLPWFGGSAAVWIMCLLFFQADLLLGYLYAHLLVRRLGLRWQVAAHGTLLALSLLWLPVIPHVKWSPKPDEDPSWLVLAVLTGSIGLPYALLAATSPLLQTWYAQSNDRVLPYRYFALSNGGSLLALLCYPVLIEPYFETDGQSRAWIAAYAGFVLLCAVGGLLAVRSGDSPAYEPPRRAGAVPSLPVSSKLFWVALAACASTLLLVVTSLLTANIAPIPLLWVLPLSVYLLSFILCFESNRWYPRPVFLSLVIPALGCLAAAAGPIREKSIALLIPLLLVSLFICCMACHGELARLKPDRSRLTTFYLLLAAGGALGGIAVALVAPHIFPAMYEYPITFVACGVVLLLVTARERSRWGDNAWSAWLAATAALLVLATYTSLNTWRDLRVAVFLGRNFYGALRVDNLRDRLGRKVRLLSHGIITHGVQYQATGLKGRPTTYYARNSGVGLTWRVLEKTGPLRVGVVGLGAGTLAAYGRAGDSLAFYEINPLVVEIAKHQFTFLADCPAHTEIFLGDARLVLASQPAQHFDLLVVDAFSGDSIPVHLLTEQAFAVYLHHLQPTGVLAVHISNRYLDLAPVVARAAQQAGKPYRQADNDDDDGQEIYGASYMLISSRPQFFKDPLFRGHFVPVLLRNHFRIWTDEYSNLYRLLKFNVDE
jgi:hypothetical protein